MPNKNATWAEKELKETWLRDRKDDDIDENTRSFFEIYCKIPGTEIAEHLNQIRRQAWRAVPDPSIGMFSFYQMHFARHPWYTEIVARLKDTNGPHQVKLIELACGLGQHLRRLVQDGVSQARIAGIELESSFIDISYDLYRDRDTFTAPFVCGDVLADKSDDPRMQDLKGKFDIVHASLFFHLFDYETQKNLAKKVVGYLRPLSGVATEADAGAGVGTMILGRQCCLPKAQSMNYHSGKHAKVIFWHDDMSWQRMWDEVGEELESESGGREEWKFTTKCWPSNEAQVVKQLSFSPVNPRLHFFSVVRQGNKNSGSGVGDWL